MIFEFLDLKPRNPYLSLAMDEAIAFHYGRHSTQEWKAGVRLWSNPVSIILGRTCKPDLNLLQSNHSGHVIGFGKKEWNRSPYLCRRMSGGGTVLHGPGNINFSFFFPMEKHPDLYSVKESYRIILGIVQRALQAQGYSCRQEGHSDLVLETGNGEAVKVSGNAQFRKHGVIVHHGTLITHSHLIDMISSHLSHPPKEPGYRQGRSHSSFLGSLPDTFDITAFYNFLIYELKALEKSTSSAPIPRDMRKSIIAHASQMARVLYSSPDWIFYGKLPGSGRQYRKGNLPEGSGRYPSSGMLRGGLHRLEVANQKGTHT